MDGGLSATIQDLGRWHYQKYGVSVSGAMDDRSHTLANALVGNPIDAATVETAWHGTAFQFSQPALIAITGADLDPHAMGQRIPQWRPVWVPAGLTIQFQSARDGCYCYLAVSGGIQSPECLGSRSTQVRAKIGGWQGRSLRAGDELPIGPQSVVGHRIQDHILSVKNSSAANRALSNNGCCAADWFVGGLTTDMIDQARPIRALPSVHFSRLSAASRERFWQSDFSVSLSMDRMGYRLEGSRLCLDVPGDIESIGVARGLVQLPPGGDPIVLMADAATTGGYPVIAAIANVDVGGLAQTQPGRRIRFTEIDVPAAQDLLRQRDQELRQLIRAIQYRVTNWGAAP